MPRAKPQKLANIIDENEGRSEWSKNLKNEVSPVVPRPTWYRGYNLFH